LGTAELCRHARRQSGAIGEPEALGPGHV